MVFPGPFSRWLLRNRRYIGLCFATAMGWQLAFILWMVIGYWGYYAQEVYVSKTWWSNCPDTYSCSP